MDLVYLVQASTRAKSYYRWEIAKGANICILVSHIPNII